MPDGGVVGRLQLYPGRQVVNLATRLVHFITQSACATLTPVVELLINRMAHPPSQSSRTAIHRRTDREYPIGVICALATEKADQVYDPLPTLPGDDNSYSLAQMGVYNIVVAYLP